MRLVGTAKHVPACTLNGVDDPVVEAALVDDRALVRSLIVS